MDQNIIQKAKSKVLSVAQNILGSKTGQVVSRFGGDLNRTLQNIGTGTGSALQTFVAQPLANIKVRNMERSQNLASQAMQEKIRQQQGLSTQQNIPYLLSQSRAYSKTPDFTSSNLKFAESNLQKRIDTGTQQTGIKPFMQYAAQAVNVALTGKGLKTLGAMPMLQKAGTLGLSAGISGIAGGLSGQNPLESAAAGILQTPRIVGLTGPTSFLTKYGTTGIMDKISSPLARNIMGRGLTGLGNVVEDEILSRLDNINPKVADRVLSFGIGAFLAPVKEYEDYLKSERPEVAQKIRQVIRDIQGRYAKKIGVSKESLDYFIASGGRKVMKGEPPKMFGQDVEKINKFLEENIPGADQGFGNIAKPVGGNEAVMNAEISKGLTPEVTKVKLKPKEMDLKTLPVEPTPLKAPEVEPPVSKETMKIVQESPQETALPTGKTRTQKQPMSVGQELNQKSQRVSGSKSLDNIISTSGIDVKSKVNLLDYIRTPDRVLKKIGLGRESDLLRKSYDKYLAELPVEINKITEWSKRAPESDQRIFQYLDGKKVDLNPNELKIAGEIRSYLNTWADKLGLDKSKRITNYITHIFDKDFINKEFDPEIARLIENRVAGSVYDPFVEKRLGALGYKESAWEALDAYVKRAVRKVNMDPALEQVKKASQGLEQSQFDYVKNYIDRINMRPTKIDNLLDNTIKSFVGYKYGVRPVAYITGKGRQAVYRGALGLNVGSALRNLSQGANTYAKLGEKYTVKGYLDLIKNGTDELEKVGVLRDDMIQDRTLSATKQFAQKADKALFYLFETAEKINRGSAYYGAKAKGLSQGMNESEAIEYAKNVVRDTQFTFGRVDTPIALQSDMAKLFGQFQSFTLKQGEFLSEMASKKDWAGLARYTAASLAFVYTIGELMGMEPKDIIPSFRFSAPPALGLPYELGKTLITGKDKYGNELEPMEKVSQIGNSLIPYIPGGVQGKKTITGLRDVSQGGAYTPSGRLKYPIEQSTSNYIRGGVFGPYNLPEAKEYRGLKTTPLSEKQTQVYKESNQPKEAYKQIISERISNREIDKAKEELKNSNQTTSVVGKTYLIKDGDKISTIDISTPINKPNLTGQTEIDKKLNSQYNSRIESRITDLVKLVEVGQMNAQEAEKMINQLRTQKVSTKKVRIKKPKKVSIKKIKAPKVTKIKVKQIKMPKIASIKIKKAKKQKPIKLAKLKTIRSKS